MKFLKELYYKFYYISPIDQANTAESNRLTNYFWSLYCIGLTLTYDIVLLVLNRNNLQESKVSIVFFTLETVICIISFFVTIMVKNVPREKAYIFKNIPLYMIYLFGGTTGSIYYFYNSKFLFEGLIFMIVAAAIVICVFSVFMPFFIIFTAGFIAIAPKVFVSYSYGGLVNLIILCGLIHLLALYKRYQEKQHLELLKTQKKSLEVKTFGNFTPLFDKKVIKFSRSKSPELLAYLIYKNGSSVNTKELISVLYGDFADSSRYGGSLRLLISDIKHSLSELGIQNFFIAEYNNFRINPEVVQC
ncbi:MAG: hypothetical protein K6A89_09685, partial [Treponema sp.]|nr:hypothetical protein [Treponema sp.]